MLKTPWRPPPAPLSPFFFCYLYTRRSHNPSFWKVLIRDQSKFSKALIRDQSVRPSQRDFGGRCYSLYQSIPESFPTSIGRHQSRRHITEPITDWATSNPCVPPFLSLKGCLGWQDSGGCGFKRRADREATGIKAQVLTRQRQLMCDLEVLPLEEAAASAKALSRNSTCRRGKPLGFPKQAAAAKMVVAVDVDEVLGSFLAAQNKFIAVLYSWNHTVSEYHVYEFFRIWNCSRERGALFLVWECDEDSLWCFSGSLFYLRIFIGEEVPSDAGRNRDMVLYIIECSTPILICSFYLFILNSHVMSIPISPFSIENNNQICQHYRGFTSIRFAQQTGSKGMAIGLDLPASTSHRVVGEAKRMHQNENRGWLVFGETSPVIIFDDCQILPAPFI